MAQGYISLDTDDNDLEDIAVGRYFSILYERGCFQEIAKDDFGNISTFKMHNLMHSFAKQIAGGWSTMTHLTYFHKRDKTYLRGNRLKDEHKVLSLLFRIAEEDEDDTAERITIYNIVKMSCFKSLRVLDLHAFDLQVLPDLIGNLVHLRYLDLSHNESLLKLPNSISNLYHLQTLKLNFCCELKELPPTFGRLICLRRLEIDECEKLTCMPPGFENLSSLRTLSRFVVGRPPSQFASGFKALRPLDDLQGRLMIDLSGKWSISAAEARKSRLGNKGRLRELIIRWQPTRRTSNTEANQYELLLDGLHPPTFIELLQIEGYRGVYFPAWTSGNALSTKFPNLITVRISGSGQCITLPPFSRLPSLKHLSLRFMENVQFVEDSDNQSSTSPSPFFPSLEELTLHSFYSLEGWWNEEPQVPSASFSCLQKLKIWSCPKLTSMPLFPTVKVVDMQNINEKLLEYHSAWMTTSELQTSTVASSSSHSEISNSEPREHPQNLQDLREVQIKSCTRLKFLAFLESSINLKKLVVERLDMLSSLTQVLKQLTSLEELEVAGCKDLDLSDRCQQESCNGCDQCDVPWKFLSKLHRLNLRELPKLVTLPVGLKCITSLQHLRLEGCPALTMLPEGLKEIKSLVKIDIVECPKLMERCREGGEDWHKIKHARVLRHKSWHYALMSETEFSQKPKDKGKTVVVHSEDVAVRRLQTELSQPKDKGRTVVVHSEDPTVDVDVTVRRLQT